MTNQSFNHSRIYQTVVIVLCFALTCSLIPPQGWAASFGVGIAHAASDPVTMPPENKSSTMAQTLKSVLPPELSEQLTITGALGPNGEPNGMLVDTGALLLGSQHTATSLATPLSISRSQSAYRSADTISGTVIITFTVTNNQQPINAPELSDSATITESVVALATVDFSKDPNTIHNVLVADSLTSYAEFFSASPTLDQNVPQYAWNLGDVPPLNSVTATLAVSVPATVMDFIELDTGATAWGTFQGRIISAKARVVGLAPDTLGGEQIGNWLKWTVDADTRDEYMLVKAAELGQDPQSMFKYVRSLGYESYKGSLRGTRGTLWSQAGNSLDQASLRLTNNLSANATSSPLQKF